MILHKFLLLLLSLLAMSVFNAALATGVTETPAERWRQYTQKRDVIYERMARYGINRDDMAEMFHLTLTVDTNPNPDPNSKIAAEKVLKPGEHYRMEVDDYVMTMLVPDAEVAVTWMVPYANTKTPPEYAEKFSKGKYGRS